jgi:hypothetical protein
VRTTPIRERRALINPGGATRRCFLPALGAAFFFFVANFSFYLVMTLFLQRGLKIPPLALVAFYVGAPTPILLALTMIIFGYSCGYGYGCGQGLVMAQLSGAGLSTVKPAAAGTASGTYGTAVQIGNAAGVAANGAVFFAVESLQSSRAAFTVSLALFAALITICAAFPAWMRRASARS